MTPPGSARKEALLAGLVVLVAHAALYPGVTDLDAFYHIGHAELYGSASPFDTALPWLTQSEIGARGADLWWGFHLLLVPFTWLVDVPWAMRLSALALTGLFVGGVSLLLRRHDVEHAALWAALALIAVPNVLYRLLAVRPHIPTLLASLVLLSALVRGRWWWVALVAAAMSWLHLALFWMAPGLVAAYAMVRLTLRAVGAPVSTGVPAPGVPIGRAIGAVLVGTSAGWLLRPLPIEAASLANVQIVVLMTEKAASSAVGQAAEMFPLSPLELVRTSWSFLAVWVAAVGWTVRGFARDRLANVPGPERTLLLSTVLVSLAFLVLALVTARRAQVQWVVFGFMTLPLVWTHLVGATARSKLAKGLAVLLVAHVAWTAHRHRLNVELVAFPAETLAEAAGFLRENSRPGEVVFHARWDNFGPLFAFNRVNRYIGGMDPIFQYAHDPRRYWEYFYLSAEVAQETTCDAFPCEEGGTVTDTHEVLREHFGARWVLTEPRRNPRFTLYLLNDSRYRLAFESQREAVFEVLP